jgi:hypothetical protein
MGQQVLSGRLTNLVNAPFPVNAFEPRSYLQKMSDFWAHPQLLAGAATATDPLERLKLLAAFLVAGEECMCVCVCVCVCVGGGWVEGAAAGEDLQVVGEGFPRVKGGGVTGTGVERGWGLRG